MLPNFEPRLRDGGLCGIEDLNAQLEWALITEYLKPYESHWAAMTTEMRKQLQIEASTYASGKMAMMASFPRMRIGV